MTEPVDYLDPETLSKLRGLDLKARLIVEGFVSGLHRSPYHGFSVEFAEHREYVPGGDLRHVDWKLYGKSDRYYLKQFEVETNFACHFIVDASESMAYQSESAPLSKLEYAKHLAAAIAYLVIQQQDAAGLATLDAGVRDYVPPSSQPSHLRLLLHRLEELQPTGETQLGPVLHDLAERIRKRGLIILLSDLFDDPQSLLAGLKHFRYRKHDVSVLQIVDPAEQDFPFDQPTRFVGMEHVTEQQADPRSIADAYRREFDRFLTETRHLVRDLGMDHSLVRTDSSLDAALRGFLQTRSRIVGHV